MLPSTLGPFALVDGDDGDVLLFSSYLRSLTATGDKPGEISQVFAAIESARARSEWCVLAADYELAARFDPAMASSRWGAGRLRVAVFASCQRLSAAMLDAWLDGMLYALPEHERRAGVAEVLAALTEAQYVGKVERIKDWIASGDCYQINLTFPLDFRVYGHPLALYAALRQRQPVRYGAYLALPDGLLLSFSPELFFERRGARVVTRPMKGTAPRGASVEEDRKQRESMLASEKERAENVMIVDLLRNDLGRLAVPGKVRVDVLCEAEAYPTLWQQVSVVSADLPYASLAELFAALFPCGSITGAPKIRAMQRIDELEEASRGLYTGALGWAAPNGDCRFNVAIRTFEVDAEGEARLGVGSGIVIDADPEREYAECLLKARFLTGYDPGFGLIETMRLEQGRYPLQVLHLDRLLHSAATLGFALDETALVARLNEHAADHPQGVFRTRLVLSHDGSCAIATGALERPDDERAWRVRLAEEVLPDNDYLRGHKTTVRERYDRTLASLPDGVFDALFFNARGELCEGARSNVFVVRDGQWLTPPVRCGVLPGVMRRSLLAAGRAQECVLYREDLLAAQEIYLANALRGVIRVCLD